VSAVLQGARDPEAIRRAVESVLARDEFVRPEDPGPSWLAKLGHEFLKWLEDIFDLAPGGAGMLLQTLLYALLAIGFVLLLVALLRGALARAREPAAPGTAGLRAARVAELLAQARAADARGELAQALRFYFWALVVGLSERGDLEYRDAWTNRELVERGHPRPEVQRLLAALVPDLDAKSFGPMPATAADVEQLSSLCREHLGVSAV
jgi:hypothetical protein